MVCPEGMGEDSYAAKATPTSKLVLVPVSTINLVRSAPERVGQLCATSSAGARGHVVAHVDVACEHTLQQFLVGGLVHLQ